MPMTGASSPPNVGYLPFWMKRPLMDNRPFRIKQIYVTEGDINPFIIRTIVHKGSLKIGEISDFGNIQALLSTHYLKQADGQHI